jgi:PAS domain S-box-containing protein
MVPRVWLYLLAAALVADFLISGTAQLAELRAGSVGEQRHEDVAALAGLLALLVAVVAGLGLARAFARERKELERSGQVAAAAASMSHDWLWESDPTGRLTYSSPGVTALLGYRPEELVGRRSEDLLHEGAAGEEMRSVFGAARAARTGWDNQVALWRHRDGSPVELRGDAVALKDRKGRVVGYRGARRPSSEEDLVRKEVDEKRRRVDAMIAGHDVRMALQPLVSLVTGEVAGVEALARFADGRGPDQWFLEAQECGRLRALDELTFSSALDLFAELPESVYLSVNASPDLLVDPGFGDILATSGLPLHRLVIEITEHARVADYAALKSALARLRQRGVRFAIDDTGAGYASLNHVLQLRPDIIKLDRALILDLEHDPARRSLVTALVLLALEIGASVTGEGVETSDQLQALSTLGVDHAQGYLLSRPCTDSDEWTSWWHRRWVGAVPAER